ncbi:MAG: hypothetical protein AMK71_03760 [Nitrospira bacterium SG8_35_4]|nr:MAG: hypothetical protein AMK71_03760 [Nitrospira bacterium SG8_35_4]
MEKRHCDRITVNQDIFFCVHNAKRVGILTDCSESGMYIKSLFSYPFESLYKIQIPLDDDLLELPVKVVRIVKSGEAYDGMGVRLLNLPQRYLEFVIRRSLESQP